MAKLTSLWHKSITARENAHPTAPPALFLAVISVGLHSKPISSVDILEIQDAI